MFGEVAEEGQRIITDTQFTILSNENAKLNSKVEASYENLTPKKERSQQHPSRDRF